MLSYPLPLLILKRKSFLDYFSLSIDEKLVFGSRAMGNEKTGSDIDLALVGEDIQYEDVLNISSLLNGPYRGPLHRHLFRRRLGRGAGWELGPWQEALARMLPLGSRSAGCHRRRWAPLPIASGAGSPYADRMRLGGAACEEGAPWHTHDGSAGRRCSPRSRSLWAPAQPRRRTRRPVPRLRPPPPHPAHSRRRRRPRSTSHRRTRSR